MTNEEIINWCESQDKDANIVILPEHFFEMLTKEQLPLILNYFNSDSVVRLPQREIRFFEWLKKNDPKIWDDLWNDDLYEPYLVSLSFLKLLLKEDYKGFPICDLKSNDNYFFTPRQMVDKESSMLVESSKIRFLENESLTPAQTLALMISFDWVDIWHFAYNNRLPLEVAFDAVKQLVEDNVVVHLKESEHLSVFIDF